MSYADKALYQAKQRGRNQTVKYIDRPADKENGKKVDKTGSVIERRKYPRIQTLIKTQGGINNKERFSGNSFDISYSGLCLSGSKPLEINRLMSIRLYLPDINKKVKKTRQVDVEGLVVWCKRINDYSRKHDRNKQQSESSYLIGIQFSKISKKDRAYLQKYFVSIFKRERV